MNKSQLVDALADRLGDRRTAATAVDAVLQIVVDTVRAGDSVSLAGFGVFESRARAARTGRNPRTGEAVQVPATTVPAFRPGTGFKTAVAGDAPAASAPSRRTSAAKAGVNGSSDVAAPVTATTLADPSAPAKGGKKAQKAQKAQQKEKGKKKGKKK